MKETTFFDWLALIIRAQQAHQRVINLEQKQKPFAELTGETIRTMVCVN